MSGKLIRKSVPKIAFVALIMVLCCSGYVIASGTTQTTIGPGNITTGKLTSDSVTSTQWYSGSDNVTDVLNYPIGVASYIIFTDGAQFHAKNGMTGIIEYSGTNAAAVIQYALNIGGEVYIQQGNYPISATLIIPENTSLIGTGSSTIFTVTMTKAPVVELLKSATFANLMIAVPSGYTGTALYFDGSEHYDFNLQTIVSDLIITKPYDNNSGGTAIQLEANETEQGSVDYIVGVSFTNIYIYGNWSVGIKMEQKGANSVNWINGNYFGNIQINGVMTDVYQSTQNMSGCNGNIFNGLQIEKRDGIYSIVIAGSYNIFTGVMIWDVQANQVPVYFNTTATRNCIMLSSSRTYNIGFAGGVNQHNQIIDVIGGSYTIAGNINTTTINTTSIYAQNYYTSSGSLLSNTGSLTNTSATTFYFTHGLAKIPTFVSASFSTTTVTGWTWKATTSMITITVAGNNLPSSMTCYWYATYKP